MNEQDFSALTAELAEAARSLQDELRQMQEIGPDGRGFKACARRARRATLTLTSLGKTFRKASIDLEK